MSGFGDLTSYQALANPGYGGALTSQLPPFMDGAGSAPGAPGMGMPPMGGGMTGMNIASAGISGLQTLGSLWMSFKAQKMAAKNFKFQKDITNTNLANQIKSYNTALSDRARGRGVMEGQSQATQDAYVADNSLSRNQSRPTGYNNNYRESSAVATPVTASGLNGLSAVARRATEEDRRVGG